MQDCEDESVLPFIKFDSATGCQKVKIAILVEFQLFLAIILVFFFISYFFAFITFGDFEMIKQAPGHNHENTIIQPGQCPFKTTQWRYCEVFIYIVYIQNCLRRNKNVKHKLLSLTWKAWKLPFNIYLTKQIAPIYSFTKHISTRITSDLARLSYKCHFLYKCMQIYVIYSTFCKFMCIM